MWISMSIGYEQAEQNEPFGFSRSIMARAYSSVSYRVSSVSSIRAREEPRGCCCCFAAIFVPCRPPTPLHPHPTTNSHAVRTSANSIFARLNADRCLHVVVAFLSNKNSNNYITGRVTVTVADVRSQFTLAVKQIAFSNNNRAAFSWCLDKGRMHACLVNVSSAQKRRMRAHKPSIICSSTVEADEHALCTRTCTCPRGNSFG